MVIRNVMVRVRVTRMWDMQAGQFPLPVETQTEAFLTCLQIHLSAASASKFATLHYYFALRQESSLASIADHA